MNPSTENSTEGLRVLKAARDTLNTIPPTDKTARFCASLIGLMDLFIHGGAPTCAICGAPPRYEVSWKTIPIPDEPDKWYCAKHRDQIEERDLLRDYGDHYVRKAAVPFTVKHPTSGEYYAVREVDGVIVEAAGPLYYDPEHEWTTDELEGELMNRSVYDLQKDAAWLRKELKKGS